VYNETSRSSASNLSQLCPDLQDSVLTTVFAELWLSVFQELGRTGNVSGKKINVCQTSEKNAVQF